MMHYAKIFTILSIRHSQRWAVIIGVVRIQNVKDYLHQTTIFSIFSRLVRYLQCALVSSALITLTLFTGITQADDTDIYFSPVQTSFNADTVLGRLLFLVDNSSSMRTIGASGSTRMEELKATFRGIFQNSVDNLAVGIMSFNGLFERVEGVYGTGGSVYFPMRKLNDPITAVISEGSSITNFARRIAGTSNNDALERLNDGAVSITGRLDIGGTSGRETMIALRFTDVDIPRNAVIQAADLSTLSSSNDFRAAGWAITAEASGDSAAFTATNRNLSSRPTTTASARYISTFARTFDQLNVCAAGSCPISDLATVIQEVVSRSDWCGGNALTLFIRRDSGVGNRQIYGLDSGRFASAAPQLNVTYDGSNADCRSVRVSTNPASGADDGFETVANSIIRTNVRDMPMVHSPANQRSAVGLRFPNVSIPQGVTISDVSLTLHTSFRLSSNATIRLSVVNQDTMPLDFSRLPGDSLSSGLPRTATVSHTIPANSTMTTINSLAPLIQSVVNRSGWTGNSALGVIIEPVSGSSFSIVSRDGPARQYPYLQLRYATNAVAGTVRQRLLETIEDMGAVNPDTPLAEAIAEAASYWAGGPVVWGSNRGSTGTGLASLSHPASYCTQASPGDPVTCPGAVVNRPARGRNLATDEYGTAILPGCRDRYDISQSCNEQNIVMTRPNAIRYRSPFIDVPISSSANECGVGNHLVVMTDGDATSASLNLRRSMLQDLFQTRQCASSSNQELCARETVEFLNTRDLDQNNADTQSVTTHTISFYISSPTTTRFLRDLAEKGGGDFYSADSVESLTDAFQRIIEVVKSDNGSAFATPSLAANAFNRLLSRDEVYFGLFQPSNKERWNGNLKKYGLCVDSADGCTLGNILDANGNVATGTDNQFLETSKSFWSAAADGGVVTAGGMGKQVDDFTSEKIYTDFQPLFPPSPPLARGQTLAGNNTEVTHSNYNTAPFEALRNEICGFGASDCDSVMRWWLGANVFPSPDTDASANTRWTIADILHSSPVTVTYGGNNSGDFYDRVIVGSNEGAIHFVNAETGEQEWRFYPQTMLGKIRQAYADKEQTLEHVYGMDLTPVVRIVDNNSNGKIEPDNNDLVHAYFGMRRGGSRYYALDITPASTWSNNNNTIVPKFLWTIPNIRTTGFNRIGQTWSIPVLATLRTTSGTAKEVLIFGGGYDPRLDGTYDTNRRTVVDGFGTQATGGESNLGNAIYFADPDTGAELFSITGPCLSALLCFSDLQVADMKHSIAAEVTVFDSDGDGFDDRLYVGDTGGQVWRVDLGAGIPSGSKSGTVVGKLVAFGNIADRDQRKIFEKISVVQVRDTVYAVDGNQEYDYVFVGTGDRANPLETRVSNNFYALRDLQIAGLADSNNDNKVDGNSYTISPGSILNITSRTDGLDANTLTDRTSRGWRYEFPLGEKVLSAATVISGTVFFTTYIPEADADLSPCKPALGSGRAYNFDVLSSKVSLDWDADGDLKYNKDRSKELGRGIPSDIVPIFTDEGVVGVVGVEGGVSGLGKLSDLPRVRTYWYEEI